MISASLARLHASGITVEPKPVFRHADKPEIVRFLITAGLIKGFCRQVVEAECDRVEANKTMHYKKKSKLKKEIHTGPFGQRLKACERASDKLLANLGQGPTPDQINMIFAVVDKMARVYILGKSFLTSLAFFTAVMDRIMEDKALQKAVGIEDCKALFLSLQELTEYCEEMFTAELNFTDDDIMKFNKEGINAQASFWHYTISMESMQKILEKHVEEGRPLFEDTE